MLLVTQVPALPDAHTGWTSSCRTTRKGSVVGGKFDVFKCCWNFHLMMLGIETLSDKQRSWAVGVLPTAWNCLYPGTYTLPNCGRE